MGQLYFRVFFVSFLLSLAGVLSGQHLHTSRMASPVGLVFKLDNKQAEKIIRDEGSGIQSMDLHTPYDSYPLDSGYTRSLPFGQYLFVKSVKNQLSTEFRTINHCEVKVLNNQNDLVVQVYDLKGNLVSDASVSIKGDRIRYDKRSASYRKKKTNKNGLLSVSFKGHTSYFHIEKSYNNSLAKRVYRRVIFGSPLKYVARPVLFVLNIPIDTYRSIKDGYPRGSIYKISHPFGDYYNFFEKVGCFFYRYACEVDQKYNSYLITDKPMYKPGDTVKIKALIQKKNGKPFTKPLKLAIGGWSSTKAEFGWVYPTERGTYMSRFILHDSLNLMLDARHNITLKDDLERDYTYGDFRLEEYELNNITLKVRSEKENHSRADTVVLYVSAHDDNNLPVPDGSLHLTITPDRVHRYFSDNVFIADTLWNHSIALDPVGETKIVLPDSLFPPVSMSYKIQCRLQTSDGKIESKDLHHTMEGESSYLSIGEENDSLKISYQVNEKEVTGPATLLFYQEDPGSPSATVDIQLPAKVAISPLTSALEVRTGKAHRRYSFSQLSSNLSVSASRSADSLHVVVSNPRHIPFNWQLYYKDHKLMEGRDETLALHQPSRGKGHYFFAIQHVWANKPVTENYVIDFKDKSLDIQIDAPSVILPGDEKEISITVKDPRGRPVEDVDLLSYGLTSKFKNYSPPDLPDHHKFRKSRKLINEFNPRVVEQKERDQRMDFKRWKRTLGLDSLEYYKFLYPTGGLYTARTPAPGGETQFSLFVMKEGKPVPVSVIQADRRPVYFSWALNNRYAFAIDSGRHTIRIRTAEREFELTDIYFEKGMKTVISIPWDYTGKGVNAEDKKKYLSEYEKRLYYSYVIKLQSVENQLAYLKSGNGVFQWEGLGRHTIGPLYRKSFDFYSPGRFTLNNIEREPFYTYEIKPEMARLTSFDMPRGKQRLIQYGELKDHRDFVLRESDILDELDNRKLQMLMGFSMFDYPRTTDAGYASLEISLDTTVYLAKGAPFFKILRNIDDDGDFEVYPGREKVFHNLEEGRYQMITLFFDSTYFISDTLSVKTRGTNYRKLTPVNYLGRDDFWRETMNYLMEMATKSYGRDPYRMERVAPREIQKIYYKEHVYTEGNTAWGTVMDEDGTPLPGVSIVIKGTAIGTVTDMEGYYELNVPNGSYTLTYSFIGFATIEKEGYGSKRADVGMQADVTQLSEVVVVAYGVQRESKAMGFSVSNVSEALMGMAPGVSITNVQNAGDIRIRGNSTLGDNSSPLYIIDGVPYTGDPGTLSPDMIANIEVLKDKSLTAIYGSRAEGGVVLITTKGSHTVSIPTLLGNRENEADLYPMSMDAASLRNNFSDAAFWKPDLITDKNGEVSFKATFPDDITRWDLHVLGVKKKQTGMAKTTVRSFKPLSAQLALPRFLVEGDSAMIIGKTMNYTSDSLAVTTHFSLNDKDTARHEFTVVNAIIDSLMLTGMKGNDTLKVRYMLNRPDGYFDGEEREIPIIPAGTVKRVGDIMLLDRDTTLSLPTLPGKGPVVITASATFMEALVKQAERLVQYQYECNEQLASKLLGYLTLEKLEPGKSRAKEIKEHINKLQNNQNREELWGWWNKSGNTSFWISEHVLYALGEARKSGYGVQLKTSRAIDQLLLDFGRTDARRKIDMLELLKQMDQRLNISGYLKAVPSMDSLSPHDQFRLLLLQDNLSAREVQEVMLPFGDTTYFGNFYWADTVSHGRSVTRSDYSLTLYALDLLSTVGLQKEKDKAINYFIEEMNDGYWANTYHTSRILHALAKELGGTVEIDKKEAGLRISTGNQVGDVREFPYQAVFDPADGITVQKTGQERVFFSWYQEEHVRQTAPFTRYFSIETKFINKGTGRETENFTKGEHVKVHVSFTVQDNEDYVMVEIPIPAGCSYGVKQQDYRDTHREYFKEKVSVFYDKIRKGEHTIEFELIPRFSGSYQVNPAKVELMYFPVVYGVNSEGKVTVH